ncbi:MAG: nitroreductase/quinone reductase family protein [Actinomycetota bacterium]
MPTDVASLDFCYLTTTGRITGKPHRIEIWFALADQTVFLMAGDRDRSDWVRNLMITPDVELELAGRKRATRARAVDGSSEEDALARRLMLEKYAGRDGGDLSTWGRTALVVAIEWPVSVSYTSLI